ncbi:uncharacterized protein LOC143027084 [Oratosquilla oratoria]|uniref:uncharacterized protein LOC143027084 n=1 Tax=Oratosquilla oratoria TaxID=337810 RepID=UPI003F76B237
MKQTGRRCCRHAFECVPNLRTVYKYVNRKAGCHTSPVAQEENTNKLKMLAVVSLAILSFVADLSKVDAIFAYPHTRLHAFPEFTSASPGLQLGLEQGQNSIQFSGAPLVEASGSLQSGGSVNLHDSSTAPQSVNSGHFGYSSSVSGGSSGSVLGGSTDSVQSDSSSQFVSSGSVLGGSSGLFGYSGSVLGGNSGHFGSSGSVLGGSPGSVHSGNSGQFGSSGSVLGGHSSQFVYSGSVLGGGSGSVLGGSSGSVQSGNSGQFGGSGSVVEGGSGSVFGGSSGSVFGGSSGSGQFVHSGSVLGSGSGSVLGGSFGQFGSFDDVVVDGSGSVLDGNSNFGHSGSFDHVLTGGSFGQPVGSAQASVTLNPFNVNQVLVETGNFGQGGVRVDTVTGVRRDPEHNPLACTVTRTVDVIITRETTETQGYAVTETEFRVTPVNILVTQTVTTPAFSHHLVYAEEKATVTSPAVVTNTLTDFSRFLQTEKDTSILTYTSSTFRPDIIYITTTQLISVHRYRTYTNYVQETSTSTYTVTATKLIVAVNTALVPHN